MPKPEFLEYTEESFEYVHAKEIIEELCEELTFEKEPYGDIDLLDGEDVVIDMEN